MDDHDLDVMMRRAREFLTENNKVKMVVKFTGRQMAHPEFGHQIMEKAIGILSDISKVEKERRFEGRNLISMLSPEKKGNKNNAEEENKEISI